MYALTSFVSARNQRPIKLSGDKHRWALNFILNGSGNAQEDDDAQCDEHLILIEKNQF